MFVTNAAKSSMKIQMDRSSPLLMILNAAPFALFVIQK